MSNMIASNKKVFRDYFVLERFDVGIELKGSEVKSIRAGHMNLNDSYCRVEAGQIFLCNTHINPYEQASYLNVDSIRQRRLLLHKKQIRKIDQEISQKGLTLVPLKAYFNDRGFVKLEIALSKGKKSYDHREDIKNREIDRKIKQTIKSRNR
jgi:SsrA-binding protein